MPNAISVATNSPSDSSPLSSSPTIQKSFKATFRWVRRIIQEASEELDGFGLTADEKTSVEIVLAEALNNVVEHSYPEDDPGEIHLSLRLRGSGLMVEIRDQGRPMPNGRVPLGDHPITSDGKNPMPEGGFGWFLIRELVQDLIYDRRDGENIVLFRLTLGSRLKRAKSDTSTASIDLAKDAQD